MALIDKLDRVEYLLKHLPGKHNQQLHDPHKGGGTKDTAAFKKAAELFTTFSGARWGAMTPDEWNSHFAELGYKEEDVKELDTLLRGHGAGGDTQKVVDARLAELANEKSSLGDTLREQIRLEDALHEEYIKSLDSLWDRTQMLYEDPLRVDFEAGYEKLYRMGDVGKAVQSWTRHPGGAQTSPITDPGSRMTPDSVIDVRDLQSKGYHVLGGYTKMMGAPGEGEITLIRANL
jgi:RNAse (barnase) inhibitor barstar